MYRRLLCRLGAHKWNKWRSYIQMSRTKGGTYTVRQRECLICDRTERQREAPEKRVLQPVE